MQHWPERLWIVRHGESAGNVAWSRAVQERAALIDIAGRDVDVPLSPLGVTQAAALGRWFATLGDARPNTALVSPYARARATAQGIAAAGGIDQDPRCFHIDERLREKETGILDRLTRQGVEARHPEQAEFRRLLGKFYHRPPGGESWADVILRLRSAMNSINLQYADRRVLIVCHQVVVFCMRYILEELDESQIMEIDKQSEIYNCGICAFDFQPDDLAAAPTMALWNHAAPPLDQAAPVTSEPDAMVASR